MSPNQQRMRVPGDDGGASKSALIPGDERASDATPLVGNTPDEEQVEGALRPGREEPDGFGG